MPTLNPRMFFVAAHKLLLGALAVLVLAAALAMAHAKPLTITLLGTGSPATRGNTDFGSVRTDILKPFSQTASRNKKAA